ncbi:MAG: hypothetical protein KKB31_06310 [Nanoarchaeota archaeon]|nr:hypothetical protein [Nanoarchaeota archaeon]
MIKPTIYPAGSFSSNWRDSFKTALPNFHFSDPRNHRQHAIAKLVEDDMNASQGCNVLLAYFQKGYQRGTMTYAEIGAARARGIPIITVDEDSQEPLFLSVASYAFSDKEKAFKLLRSGEYESKFSPIKQLPEEICKKVLFVGNLENFSQIIQEIRKTKTCLTSYDSTNLDDFARDVDILVVNFNSGERNREAIFYMGICYALDIPVILCTGNQIVYPPLAGIARRIFPGPNRGAILVDYLNNLNKQDIQSEAQIYYALEKKYNFLRQ